MEIFLFCFGAACELRLASYEYGLETLQSATGARLGTSLASHASMVRVCACAVGCYEFSDSYIAMCAVKFDFAFVCVS